MTQRIFGKPSPTIVATSAWIDYLNQRIDDLIAERDHLRRQINELTALTVSD